MRLDNEVLDEVAVGPGSIVAWIRVEDETEWNDICKTIEPAWIRIQGGHEPLHSRHRPPHAPSLRSSRSHRKSLQR